jgi:predicted CXXCH cytochrome family protein
VSAFFQMPMRVVCFLRPFCLAVAFCLVGAIGASAQEPQLNDPGASKYVGAEVCQGCHEDAYKTFAASKHLKTLKRSKTSEQGCEGCHGPGADHAEAGDPDKILRFPSASPAAIREACTVCHQANLGAAHEKAALTCLTCHSAHHYMEREAILIAPTVQLCRRCHKF